MSDLTKIPLNTWGRGVLSLQIPSRWGSCFSAWDFKEWLASVPAPQWSKTATGNQNTQSWCLQYKVFIACLPWHQQATPGTWAATPITACHGLVAEGDSHYAKREILPKFISLFIKLLLGHCRFSVALQHSKSIALGSACQLYHSLDGRTDFCSFLLCILPWHHPVFNCPTSSLPAPATTEPAWSVLGGLPWSSVSLQGTQCCFPCGASQIAHYPHFPPSKTHWNSSLHYSFMSVCWFIPLAIASLPQWQGWDGEEKMPEGRPLVSQNP